MRKSLEKVEFKDWEIDPVAPAASDRRSEIAAIFGNTDPNERTVKVGGGKYWADCQIQTRDGRTVQIVVTGRNGATRLLRRYIVGAGLTPI